jgi:SAM-dependent methyltransferase
MTTRDPYAIWSEQAVITALAAKSRADFFRSEHHFLAPLAARLTSILDIGCGCGRLRELLPELGCQASYSGLDVSAEMVARARGYYPDATFYCGNALDLELPSTFDLVNATGVLQHEPRYAELLGRMLGWARRYVLCDLKLAHVATHLIDEQQSYCLVGGARAFFVVLAWPLLRQELLALQGVARVSVWGYETPVNDVTTVPPWVGGLASAGILIEKGRGPQDLVVDLPSWLVEPAEER